MIVLMFSGGLDSMLLAHKALKAGKLAATVYVDYGAPNTPHERRAVAEWHRRHARQIPHHCVVAPVLEGLDRGVGTAGPRVVPNRNLLILSMGLAVAAQVGAEEVWYGANADDSADYPDCRPEFLIGLNELAAPFGIKVRAPWIDSTKAMVMGWVEYFGADLSLAWSCYQPRDGAPCGACGACVLRASAAP